MTPDEELIREARLKMMITRLKTVGCSALTSYSAAVQLADDIADALEAQLTAHPARGGGEKLLDECERALQLILPLAKGYAHRNRVGANAEYIAMVERLLERLASPSREDGAGGDEYPKFLPPDAATLEWARKAFADHDAAQSSSPTAPADEREAVARIIDPDAYGGPAYLYRAGRQAAALAKADAILASRQSGGWRKQVVEVGALYRLLGICEGILPRFMDDPERTRSILADEVTKAKAAVDAFSHPTKAEKEG